jgi:secretion/DNA translocation related TadE-like protein
VRHDRGSATIWVLAAATLVLALATAVALRTAAVLARHRASAAADAAALAAADQIGVGDQPCAAAARSAAANGARLLTCTPDLAVDGRSGTVTVIVARSVDLPVVGVQTVRARARAERTRA